MALGNGGRELKRVTGPLPCRPDAIYRALRVERLLQNGLKFETGFYELFYRFQDRIGEFADSQTDRVNKYLIRYAELRKNAYTGESQSIPEIDSRAIGK
jgi:hypothetical protein